MGSGDRGTFPSSERGDAALAFFDVLLLLLFFSFFFFSFPLLTTLMTFSRLRDDLTAGFFFAVLGIGPRIPCLALFTEAD